MIGVGGVFMCLCAYTLNVLLRLPTDGVVYPALNAIRSGLIFASLSARFNLAAALMEGSWLIVSLFAVWKSCRSSVIVS